MPAPFLRGPRHPGRAIFSARSPVVAYNEYRDVCSAGSVAVTGIAAAFKISQPVAAGSFAETGNPIGGRIAEALAAGAFTETGKPIGLKIADTLAAGALAAAGQPIGAILRGVLLGPGSYTIGGVSLPDDQFTTKCSAGVFTITGFDISLIEPAQAVETPIVSGFRRIITEVPDPSYQPPRDAQPTPSARAVKARQGRSEAPLVPETADSEDDDLILALILLDVL